MLLRVLGTVIGLLVVCGMTTTSALAQSAPVGQHAERAAAAPPTTDELRFGASLGGNLSTGNTRSMSLAFNAKFGWKAANNSLGIEADVLYGRASVKAGGAWQPWDTSAESFSGKARYDRFFTENDTIFGSLGALRNRFAGLDSRLQLQVGYMRNLYVKPQHRLWVEAGYDLSADNYDPDPLRDPGTGEILEGSDLFHSARIFLGYDNHLSELVTFATGLESLFDVEEARNFRFNWTNEIGLKVAGDLSVGAKFVLRVDNLPVPSNDVTDTTTLLTVTYAFQQGAE